MARFDGRHILVTGGASGIGREVVTRLVRAGATVVVSDINKAALDGLEQAVEGLSGTIHTHVVDVSRREEVFALARWVEEHLGRLDVLVNNAGIPHSGEMVETPLETWERLVAVNFWGPLYHVYAFLPMMLEAGKGQIVNVSSGQAFVQLPTWGPYTVVKAAVGVFSQILHDEVSRLGIDVSTVYPFLVNTPFYAEVEGETWTQRLSMKLLPYYSLTPERVADQIVRTIATKRSVEMTSIMNTVAKYLRVVPGFGAIFGGVTARLLGKDADAIKRRVLASRGKKA